MFRPKCNSIQTIRRKAQFTACSALESLFREKLEFGNNAVPIISPYNPCCGLISEFSPCSLWGRRGQGRMGIYAFPYLEQRKFWKCLEPSFPIPPQPSLPKEGREIIVQADPFAQSKNHVHLILGSFWLWVETFSGMLCLGELVRKFPPPLLPPRTLCVGGGTRWGGNFFLKNQRIWDFFEHDPPWLKNRGWEFKIRQDVWNH